MGAVGAGAGGGRNARTTLKRRVRPGDPMAHYDRLPGELRAWLAQAALPWSPRSALRAWEASLRRCRGDRALACALLSGIEARQIRRDARRMWGEGHPSA